MALLMFYSHTEAVYTFSVYKLGVSPKSHEYANIVVICILLSSKAILGASTLIALQARLVTMNAYQCVTMHDACSGGAENINNFMQVQSMTQP